MGQKRTYGSNVANGFGGPTCTHRSDGSADKRLLAGSAGSELDDIS
jgi:hypothetical protein